MRKVSILEEAQERFHKYGRKNVLRWPDAQKDRDIITLYQDMCQQAGKHDIPLALQNGGGTGSLFVHGLDESLMILNENLLRDQGVDMARSVIAHELGHSSPDQILRMFKKNEISQTVNASIEAAVKNAKAPTRDVKSLAQVFIDNANIPYTLSRFSAYQELSADRYAARLVPPAVLAQSLEKEIKRKLNEESASREALYPGKTPAEALEDFEKDLQGNGMGKSEHIKRIIYLRNMASQERAK